MTLHHHGHHHHPPGRAHPPAAMGWSLLRLPVGGRLGIAAALLAAMWLAVFWAMA
ncbi:MAG TPA: hypothetical protein VNQ99_15590 [Xanthobacteraceae bacterium]|nr:hypothetical protein [Xanthobacteraceae bacterium]